MTTVKIGSKGIHQFLPSILARGMEGEPILDARVDTQSDGCSIVSSKTATREQLVQALTRLEMDVLPEESKT